jgi:hypothetical protein
MAGQLQLPIKCDWIADQLSLSKQLSSTVLLGRADSRPVRAGVASHVTRFLITEQGEIVCPIAAQNARWPGEATSSLGFTVLSAPIIFLFSSLLQLHSGLQVQLSAKWSPLKCMYLLFSEDDAISIYVQVD